MISRALGAGVPAGRVAGDEVYGADPGLRAGIEECQIGYVLAVANSHAVATAAGVLRAGVLAKKLPPRAWQRLSAGPGAKGHRWYDWAWISIDPRLPGQRWLLIRRHRRTRELACYRCYSPAGLIPLTRNEIAHLAAALIIQPAPDTGHRLRWSLWRRHHQHTAQTRHYLRQSARDP
jgi:SRSO17 transposase